MAAQVGDARHGAQSTRVSYSRVEMPDSSARSRARAMWTAVVGIAVLYMGSTILTPLYPIYRRGFGFSELVVTEIYAVYVVGNLAALCFLGRLSDQIGRRRATLGALTLTLVSAVLFLGAAGTAWLFSARVLNGLGAGLGAGALTAWIAELEPRHDRARAAVVASAGNLAGLAAGAFLAGILARYAPAPLRASYALYVALLAALMLVIRSTPETVANHARSWGQLALRPRVGIPRGLRLAFIAPAAIAFASFALGGFYAALTPGLVTTMGITNVAIVGAVVAAFFGSASIVAALSGRLKGRTAVTLAVALLLAGLALLLLAESHRAMALLYVATVVTGAAMALGYRGSLQIVNEIAPADRRAELVSSYLLCCYTANSLPVVGVGLLATTYSAEAAHRIFAIVLAVLAVIAGVAGRRGRASA
jgi:MFS family permease